MFLCERRPLTFRGFLVNPAEPEALGDPDTCLWKIGHDRTFGAHVWFFGRGSHYD